MKRFDALDSWRGIAACTVALFHLPIFSHFFGLSFIRNGFLFVDFFFVLSGFIITANYRERLRDGYGVGRFMLLRFGRLYPLHLFTIALFLLMELAILVPAVSAVSNHVPFTAEKRPIGLLWDALMIHGLGITANTGWNGPSWSISTEFFAYLVFAACVLSFRKHLWVPVTLALAVSPIILALGYDGYISTTHDLAFVRCLYGFAAGVLVYHLYIRARAGRATLANDTTLATLLELACVVAVFGFVSFAGLGVWSLAAPVVFGVTVLIFSWEAGAVSCWLRARPLLVLGMLSYSVYMMHRFVYAVASGVGRVLQQVLDQRLFTKGILDGEAYPYFWGTNVWLGDILYPVMLAIVIAVSYGTYRLIEAPSRRWFRQFADRHYGGTRSVSGFAGTSATPARVAGE